MNIMNLDKREITRLINEWNSSRYELFALSQPNDRLEFHGVMRFYFQDAGEKVSTKCIRVDSTATTEDVIEVLIEKFRPDMKSLSSPKDYAIYEVHSDAQERKLDSSERPLWIQLEWGKEGREGRFLLKNENCKTVQFDANADGLIRDKKRMSKRDKKKLLKQKEAQKENSKVNVAEHLYKEVPDSNFTRSISNPEIVMARRRQQKLENKLKQIKNRDGGGTLKVYGETLKPDIPYKTLLMSNQDTAAFAVKETLEKYGLTNEDPDNYCLVQVVTPSREEREKHGAQIKEYILEDTACPLAILMKHPSTGGSIIFQIRRCTPDILAIRKQKKKLESEKQQQQQHQNKFNTINSQSSLAQNLGQNKSLDTPEMTNQQKLPFLVELTYEGFDLPQPRIIQFKSDFYEIGNDKYLASTHPLNYIRIDPAIPGIEKKHCGIKKSSDNLQLLLIPYAETYVNDRLVKEHTQLFNGFTIRLGKYCLFRLENPNELNNIGNNKPVGTQQVQQTPVPANYGLLYDGQITEPSVHQNRALSPIQNRMEPNRMSQNQINKLTPQQTTTTPVESGLPGLLQFSDENGEDALLAQICTSQNTNWQFKLAPVYTMYMMLRYRLSRKYKPDLTFNDKLNSLPYLIHKMVNYIREAVDLNHSDKYILPYWLSNSSELLYFLKQDIHLSQVSYDAQDALAECVQITFKYIVNIMQMQLDLVLASFFDPSDHIEEVNLVNDSDIFENDFKRPTLKHVIGVLNEAMSLLRGARVNAALTIQLFSQLFHYISIWLFNRLVNDQRSGLCSFYWGERLLRRLGKIKIWAEKQGLELAADCHLQKINHAAYFLQAPKHDAQFASNISSNCFSLNSFQIKCLIKNYVMGNQEPQLSPQLLNSLIITAQNTADVVIKQEGRQLQLDEDVELQLPFLLPQDGHSSEIIKGLPAGLLEFLESLQNMGHCWLWQNNQGPGSWKKFMIKHQNELNNQASQQTPQPPPTQPVQNMYKSLPNTPIEQPQPIKNSHPKVIQIKLAKKNGGLGLSIVAAPGSNKMLGIYIKSVVPGGAAADDGRLNDGDQLLAVDDNSLINITQERAAELMTKSGPVVLLTIAKDAAVYNSVEGLNDKPVGKSQQFNPTQSMPILNNSQNFQPLQQQQQSQQNFSAQTLPRNHHLHQQSEIQEQPNYRARSMSSEILDRNPQPKIIPQLNHQQPQVQRSLPNEQQIRYGSERPVMMDHRYQRNLPNEIGPRYGSERPASTLPQQQRNNFDTSPIKQFNQPIKQRQASLNELDEIDYNNQNENNFDDLYGKVNQNRQNEQYKTLPNRPNNLNINNGIEDARTKSFGQLYEQIWSQNNNQVRQTPQHQFQQQQLVNRMNQVSLEEPKVSRSNLLFEQNRNGTMAQRNYENQMIQNQSRPPPPAVMAKPSIPAKNFNLNLQNHQNQKYQEHHVEISIQQNFTAGTAKIINQKDQYLTREKADEEFRLNLLKQRIEMLNDLESKSYRTHEEENKLNKLRTEIEFDKRVIEMKSLSNYLDETADDNDTLEYAPEVRERFANEILQRRKQFQEENEMKLDRVMEAKREEQRLKRHVDRNSNSNLQELNNQNFQELEIIHARSSTDLSELSSSRPQKHVQFMQEAEMISPKSSIGNNLKATSSSSSSDQLDSSPSTPPPLPAQPQPNHHPKRVMFSDIEFDRNEIKNDDIIHNTPSVIGANEVYVDQRLKAKLQQQQLQQQMIIEGEKLSFKDKMKLFAKQSGENLINDADNKLKVSRKQREIESKFSTENK